MKRIYVLSATLLCAALFISGSVGFAARADDFWQKAAQSGMAEVALGNLAIERSQNESVRSFARQMVSNHTAANSELMSLAQSKSVMLPASTSSSQQSAMEKLSKLSGDDFDRQFMMRMVKDHKAAVALFEKAASSNKDQDAQNFATKHLPTLRSHLQMAMSMSGSTGSSPMNQNMNMNNQNMNMNMNMDSGNSNGMRNSNMNSNSNNRNSNSNMMNSNSNMMNSNMMNSNSNMNSNRPSNSNSNSNSRNRNSNSNSNSNSNGNSNSKPKTNSNDNSNR